MLDHDRPRGTGPSQDVPPLPGATRPAVAWATDADGHVRRRLPAWEDFTGQAWSEYEGLGWLDAVHPEDRPRVADTWRQAVATATGLEMAYRLRRRDGSYRAMAAHGAPLRDGQAVREWVGVCVDLTATVETEAALQRSEERLRLLDRLGQATRTLNDATEVMAATARLLGEHLGATRCAYADVEADGDRFTIRSDWSLPGVPSSAGVYSLDLFGPQATSLLRQGRHLVVHDVDAELGDDGGGRMFKSIGIRAVICAGLVKDGRLVAMMAVHQAVPRRWSDAEVALVGEVVDRCWAHIERVRDSALLREQDRRKDEFLATLAHELRNPLAPIKYAVAMLRHAPSAQDEARARDVVDRQVSQMARLIDDLLDISRINRGLIQLQRAPVGARGVLEQAIETARPALEAAGHRLQVDWPPEDLRLDADPARVVQVVGNLLNNAAKYTPHGGRVRVGARREGAVARLEVEDNGIGVAPADQERLFDMFTQLHPDAKAKGGLGIGLALVRSLVQLHGGSVRVHSDGPQRGARFEVDWPLVAPAAVPAPAPAAREADPAGAGAPRRPRVLVVEDNRDGLETLLSLLDLMGHEVAGAADGGQAVEAARRFQPDVVLLDLGLPVMDGFEVARALRADERLRDVYIAALTGWGAEGDRRRTAEAGFDAHLTKPVDVEALEQVLAQPPVRPRTPVTG